MPDLLGTIVAAARRTTAVRRERIPLADLEARLWRTPQGQAFATALRSSPVPRVIAECKRRSPSKGILRADYDPAAHAAAYARAGAAAVSVLTEPTFFDGAPGHLSDVRAAIDLPLLRKDFIVSEYQIVESAVLGADAVLLIAGALDANALSDLSERARSLGLAALVEVHDRDELRRALDSGAGIIGVNSRDLRTLSVDPAVLDELVQHVPPGVTVVAESGIRSSADLVRLSRAGYHAFLIGERLIAEPDPGAALEGLIARCCA